VYGEQIVFQTEVVLKMSPMNCSIQVQVSSGALHIYGAALLITGVGEGVEKIFTEVARCALTAPISTASSFTPTASARCYSPPKCRIANISPRARMYPKPIKSFSSDFCWSTWPRGYSINFF